MGKREWISIWLLVSTVSPSPVEESRGLSYLILAVYPRLDLVWDLVSHLAFIFLTAHILASDQSWFCNHLKKRKEILDFFHFPRMKASNVCWFRIALKFVQSLQKHHKKSSNKVKNAWKISKKNHRGSQVSRNLSVKWLSLKGKKSDTNKPHSRHTS